MRLHVAAYAAEPRAWNARPASEGLEIMEFNTERTEDTEKEVKGLSAEGAEIDSEN